MARQRAEGGPAARQGRAGRLRGCLGRGSLRAGVAALSAASERGKKRKKASSLIARQSSL